MWGGEGSRITLDLLFGVPSSEGSSPAPSLIESSGEEEGSSPAPSLIDSDDEEFPDNGSAEPEESKHDAADEATLDSCAEEGGPDGCEVMKATSPSETPVSEAGATSCEEVAASGTTETSVAAPVDSDSSLKLLGAVPIETSDVLVASCPVTEGSGADLVETPVATLASSPDCKVIEPNIVDPCSEPPCSHPSASASSEVGPPSFVAFLKSLPADEARNNCSSYYAFKEAEEKWLKANPRIKKAVMKRGVRRRNTDSKVRYRLATGMAFIAWRKEEGKDSKRKLADFMDTREKFEGKVPKKRKVWLAECIKLASAGETTLGHMKGRKPSKAVERVPHRFLKRQRKGQGPPYKCPLIREYLWDWFVDIRRSLATTISSKFVMMKARELADQVLDVMRKTGDYGEIPQIDRNWLHRWKRDKGVVFRKPNMRFKCSRPVMKKRLRAMWLNDIKVRRLAELCLGKDLADQIFGLDEKPIHFNEGGSRNTSTLEIAGAPCVKLAQNHAATRERVSVMTFVTSNRKVALSKRRPWIELIFKAKSSRRTRLLKSANDLDMSVTWSIKGSYREDHILRLLRKRLELWTPEREASKDYRILFMDVARSHVSDAVGDFCWERGYIALYHYGCTTGVGQVNDTDCHCEFEKNYLEFEQRSFNEKQLLDPCDISRTPQEVINDVAATWKCLNHAQGVDGHWRNGLSNKLDGTEDHVICRDAQGFWNELDMPSLRLAAIAEVDAAFAAGELQWHQVRSLIQHPDDVGIQEEGAELEAVLQPGETLWADEAYDAVVAEDDKDVLKVEEEKSQLLQVEAADDPEEVAEAEILARRLVLLQRLRATAKETNMLVSERQAAEEISQLKKGFRWLAKEGPPTTFSGDIYESKSKRKLRS